MKTALLLLFLGCLTAYSQDPGAMAAQQAMQAAQQANQQAMQASQQANQQAQQDTLNAQQNNVPTVAITRQPAFSIKAGNVTPGTVVRIKSPTHYATIYFTTNGWTPTTASRRYKGPISIQTTTQLQAIAVAPNMTKSLISSATYTVPGPATPVQPLTLSADGVLHSGTRLRLVTDSDISSKTAQIGDAISLSLDQDVKIGDVVVIPKGTPVEATITQADTSGHLGTPGDVAFEVHSLNVHGTTVPLHGGETLEGANQYSKIRSLIFIPVAGAASLAIRGDEAEIKPGMTLTAAVSADTPLHP